MMVYAQIVPTISYKKGNRHPEKCRVVELFFRYFTIFVLPS